MARRNDDDAGRRDRDVPANQLLQNLEELVGQLQIRGMDLPCDERLRIEKELAAYKENFAQFSTDNGIKLRNFELASVESLNALERLLERSDASHALAPVEHLLLRIRQAKEMLGMLHGSYKDLLLRDPRIGSEAGREALASERPAVLQECARRFAALAADYGPESAERLLNGASEVKAPSFPATSRMAGGALVPVTKDLVVLYARSCIQAEVLFKFLVKREEMQLQQVDSWRQTLMARGGALSASEQGDLDRFCRGTDPRFNIARHLADLDSARLATEKWLRN